LVQKLFMKCWWNWLQHFFLSPGFLDRFHVRVHRQAGLQVRARLGHEGLRQLHPGRLSARGMGWPKQIGVQVMHSCHIIALVTHWFRHIKTFVDIFTLDLCHFQVFVTLKSMLHSSLCHTQFLVTLNSWSHSILCHSKVFVTLKQACQTQTTLRAKKATKTVEGAAKVLKNFLAGYI